MTQKYFPLFLTVFLFYGCTSSPDLLMFYVGPGINQFHFPSHEWVPETPNKTHVDLDITYRTNSENPVFINFSFYNSETNPRRLSSARLEGDGLAYSLENIKPLYIRPKNHELRIAVEGDRDTFLPLLRSERIVLRTVVDQIEYTHLPGKDFYKLRDEFLESLLD
jgi:hypothetical protein